MGDQRVNHSQTHPSGTSSLCLDGAFLLPSLRWYSSAIVLIQHMSYRCCLLCYLKYLFSQELRTNTRDQTFPPPGAWAPSVKSAVSLCFYSLNLCVALNVHCTSVHGGICTSTCSWVCMLERTFCCLAQITLANCSLSGDLSAHIIVSKGEAWESNVLHLQIVSLSLSLMTIRSLLSQIGLCICVYCVHVLLWDSNNIHIENIFSYCCIQGRRIFGKYWSDKFWVDSSEFLQ